MADPLEALRQWLVRLALDQSADAAPFAWTLLDGLRELVSPDATTADVDVEVPGAGPWSAPWRIELVAPGASQLLLWLEPDGPPEAWATAAADEATRPPCPTCSPSWAASAPPCPRWPPFRRPEGPARPTGWPHGFAAMVGNRSDGDGVVPLMAQLPDDVGWTVGGTLVDAAHHRLPEHPDAVAQVLAQVDAWAPGRRPRRVAGRAAVHRPGSWLPLLAAAEAARPGATDLGAHFDLRSAPSPEPADLRRRRSRRRGTPPTSPTPAAPCNPWSTRSRPWSAGSVSSAPMPRSCSSPTRRPAWPPGPSPPPTPSSLAGLITIGTPHGTAPLTVLDDPAQADALRLAGRLLGAAGVTGPLRDALDHLLAAAEGWQATSTLPTPLAYPRERFTGDSDHGTGGVPALAIAGQLSDDLLTRFGRGAARRP